MFSIHWSIELWTHLLDLFYFIYGLNTYYIIDHSLSGPFSQLVEQHFLKGVY